MRDAGVAEADNAMAAGAFVAFAGALARLAFKWENYHKEALWRRLVNVCWSFPKHAGMRVAGKVMPPARRVRLTCAMGHADTTVANA